MPPELSHNLESDESGRSRKIDLGFLRLFGDTLGEHSVGVLCGLPKPEPEGS
jgi:hypothetical protein